jgi:hypothetical protein
MKLAQFTSERSSVQRLGILIGERVVDVAALAASVAPSGDEGVRWLLGVTDILDVISRGEEALVEITGLIEQALARGIAEGEAAKRRLRPRLSSQSCPIR